MIDSFHLEKYRKSAVNYNRDLEVFPVLKSILYKITKEDIYYSPTDMGVNMIGSCISDNDVIEQASKREIIRRYYQASCDEKTGNGNKETTERIKLLMNELKITPEEYLPVISVAKEKGTNENIPVIALELPNGKIITGKKTELLSPASSLIINAIKELTNIPDEVYLLSPNILEPILTLRPKTSSNKTLNLQEVLIALSICSVTNPIIKEAINSLKKLDGCIAHATFMVYNGDLNTLRSLNIRLTCEPVFYSNNLYFHD